MTSYSRRYEEFTRATVKLADEIQRANTEKFAGMEYTLPQVTVVLRNIYKNKKFHEMFVGSKLSDNKWSSGFCAMASVIIYEMFGMDNVWIPKAVCYNDWLDAKGNHISSVVFLQDKSTGINFGTTGEHFYPLVVPYDIGKPIDIKILKTPNKDAFKEILFRDLAQHKPYNF